MSWTRRRRTSLATWLQWQKKSRQTTGNDGRQRQPRERTCFSFLNSLVIRQRNPMPSVKKEKKVEVFFPFFSFFFLLLLLLLRERRHNSWVRICIAKPTAITRRRRRVFADLSQSLLMFDMGGGSGKKDDDISNHSNLFFSLFFAFSSYLILPFLGWGWSSIQFAWHTWGSFNTFQVVPRLKSFHLRIEKTKKKQKNKRRTELFWRDNEVNWNVSKWQTRNGRGHLLNECPPPPTKWSWSKTFLFST